MRCLFCKKLSDTSKSKEHVIPESIGSKKLVLPAGLVCDNCNNYFSRKVEKPVLTHESMRNLRGWYQVPSKKGKMPSVKGWIAGTDIYISMKIGENGKLDIQPEFEKHKSTVEEKYAGMLEGTEPCQFLFVLDINPPQKAMSRFLAKMALEALAFHFKNDKHFINYLIDEPHFELIRNFARFGSGVKEWPYYRRSVFPMDTKMIHPETGKWVTAGFGHDFLITRRRETYFIFIIHGVEFVINIGGPSIKGYEEWLKENNGISPIIERTGVRLEKKIIEGQYEYFLEGDSDIRKSVAFDKKELEKV